MHVDEFHEATALLRWKNHDFLEIERPRRTARALSSPSTTPRLIGVLKNILPTDAKISDPDQLKAFIDSFCSSNEPEVIGLALDVLGVPDEYKRFAVKRREAEGAPPLDQLAPSAMSQTGPAAAPVIPAPGNPHGAGLQAARGYPSRARSMPFGLTIRSPHVP